MFTQCLHHMTAGEIIFLVASVSLSVWEGSSTLHALVGYFQADVHVVLPLFGDFKLHTLCP